MADIKLVVGMKDGKTVQKIIKGDDVKRLAGLKLGDSLKGESVNLAGYEFIVTGGSDTAGFPMRKDVHGVGRKKIWTTKSTGVKEAYAKGMRIRKNVAGNTISALTAQVNVKVVKEGKAPLESDKKEAKVS